MNFFRLAAIGLSSALLAACGGHGYEGKWELESDNPTILQTIKLAGAGSFTLGDDYIEVNGQRNNLDEIFVRESDGNKFLIMVKDDEEKAIEIIDDDTLRQEMGMFSIKFVRS